MHYGPYGFASDPYIPTITTKNRFQQNTIGQREGPSFLDFEAVDHSLFRIFFHFSPLMGERNWCKILELIIF